VFDRVSVVSAQIEQAHCQHYPTMLGAVLYWIVLLLLLASYSSRAK
jgi:hypothetical protein